MSTSRKRRSTVVPVDQQAESTQAVGTREMSTRASKRRKVTISTTTEHEEANESVKTAETQTGKSSTKVKRQSWTSIGIGFFFEALAENGKDFGKILKFMCAKEKKKKQRDLFSVNLSKDQVRFFYYRTWHKVSHLLGLPNQRPESNQKRTQKAPTSVPSVDNKACCSDEETEGETEAGVFDMSLDDGDDAQDVVHDQLTPSLPEDGDSMPSIGQYEGPSPPDTIEESSQSKEDTDRNHGDSSDGITDKERDGDTSDGAAIYGNDHTSGEGIQLTETTKHDKKAKSDGNGGGASVGGGEVKVNGAWHSLDLVAMICYSKLRLTCRGDKYVLGHKLKELVYNGTTTIRLKGKRKKEIKIPNCPALGNSKAHVSATSGELPLAMESSPMIPSSLANPNTLTLELRPLNSSTWCYVQKLSMNPRVRINLSSSRTVKDVCQLMGTKWHIMSNDICNVLKLYNSFPKSKHSDSVSMVTMSDHTPQSPSSCQPMCASSGIESQQVALEPTLTLRELEKKLSNESKARKISLQYEILTSERFDSSSERNLDQLIKIANFLTLSYNPTSPCTPPVLPSSPVTPPSLQHTPTDHVTVTTPPLSTHSPVPVLSSPVLVQYMKNLPKRSPVKSPLAKYKRMKQQQLRPSPLKTRQSPSTSSHRIKPVQLHFPSVVQGPAPPSEPIVPPGRKTASNKSKKGPGKKPHLVTLSKSSLKQSGSFTGLRLDDIFNSVNENLKGVQDKETQKTGPPPPTSVCVTPLTSDRDNLSPTEGTSEAKSSTPTHLTRTAEELVSSSNPIKASPLEQLASQMSSKQTAQSLQHSPSPYQINITTTSVATPTVTRSVSASTVSSPTGRPIITTSVLPKTSKRNPNSQRPVVPKPLVYLPQFTKQLASLPLPIPAVSNPTTTRSRTNSTNVYSTVSNTITASSNVPQLLAPPTAQATPSQNTMNTQGLLQVQVSLLKELLMKPVSQNHEDEQKKQQAVQTLLQSLLMMGSQYPSLLQNLDLKALLSAAVQSKPPTTLTRSRPIHGTEESNITSSGPMVGGPFSDSIVSSATANTMGTYNDTFSSSVVRGDQQAAAVYTSHDTVSDILKGLSPNTENERDSVTRLSEETADVLPNFAQAMIRLRSAESSLLKPSEPSTTAASLSPVKTVSGDVIERDSSSLGTLLSSLAQPLSTAAAARTEAGLEQHPPSVDQMMALNDVNTTDYIEVFSQLKEILSTPEKSSAAAGSKSTRKSDAPGNIGLPGRSSSPVQNKSFEDLLGIFNSPFKGCQNNAQYPQASADPASTSSNSVISHDHRTLLEESSVDYINKFKELASSMNHST